MHRTILFCVALASLSLASGRLQCTNEMGKPVDWFIMYKLPTLSTSQNPLIKKGLAYVYVTSEDNGRNGWILSSQSINSSQSMTGRTLAPIYGQNSTNIFQILYNDEPPSSPTTLAYGHTKGVVLTDNKEGLWLIHSAPKFPIEPISKVKTEKDHNRFTTKKNTYSFPKTACRFGQSFLCISLPKSEMDTVGTQLMYNKPKIYSSNVPETLRDSFINLTLAARNKYVSTGPWYHSAILHSSSGTKFVSYAKTRQFMKELYSDWVAPDLGTDLKVETWSNGAGELPSDCQKKFKVIDVLEVLLELNDKKNTSVRFKNSQDHSKWAISGSKTNPTSCIGDINRMVAQLKRGGGTVCFQNANIWKLYDEAVVNVQPCPRKT